MTQQPKIIIHEPGIYFDIPMEDYRADPALSNSGIKDLLISPLTYWVNSAYNPDREEEDSEAKARGQAYHARILEGKEAYDERFAPKLNKADFPDALFTGDQLRAKCEELGLKKGKTNMEMALSIVAFDKSIQCFPIIEADYLRQEEGKTFISADDGRRIELAAMALDDNPETAKLIQGGKPEVSIFWIDEQTGVRMKARVDYLTPETAIDLKTFANQMNNPLDLAIGKTMANYKYGIQAVTYKAGLAAVNHTAHDFIFIFNETGRVPNLRIKRFRQMSALTGSENAYWQMSEMAYREGIRRWQEGYAKWGTNPWTDKATIEDFEDEDFPSWFFN